MQGLMMEISSLTGVAASSTSYYKPYYSKRKKKRKKNWCCTSINSQMVTRHDCHFGSRTNSWYPTSTVELFTPKAVVIRYFLLH